MAGVDEQGLAPAAAFLTELVSSRDDSPWGGVAFVGLNPREAAGRVFAVDGGQSVVVNVGSCAVVAVRAAFTRREPSGRLEDVVVHDAVRLVARSRVGAEWERVASALGADPAPSPSTSGPQWVHAWLDAERDAAEWRGVEMALRGARAGDWILVDGALDGMVQDAPERLKTLRAAHESGIGIAAVTKDTLLTVGGTLPFTIEAEECARRMRVAGRFCADVTALVGSSGPWRVFAAQWATSAGAYRVDVWPPRDQSSQQALEVLTGLSRDVAYPGYPYPLARVHDRVAYKSDEAVDLRRRLEALVAERRGTGFSLRIFSRGRDVLTLGS